ncbi:MAG: hypothetical protein GXY61_05365 [Lentisphaerae bacterium]|jgi:chromosome segregation ATPase|nr:hypothetical protein [Lentisphaerota bacterium]
MQIKTVVVAMAAACAIGISTGCVKQKDLDELAAKKDAEIAALETVHAEAIAERDAEISQLGVRNDELDNQLTLLKADKMNLEDKASDAEKEVEGLNAQVRTLTRDLATARDEAQSNAAKANSMVEALDKAEKLAAFHEKQYNTLRAAFIKLQRVDPADYQADLGSVADLNVDQDAVFNDIISAAAAKNATSSSSDENVSADELIKSLLNDMGNM